MRLAVNRSLRPLLPRLTQPLVRDRLPSGERGPQRVASWDEALDRAAAGLRASKERHGASSIGIFSCSKATNEVNYLAQKFLRVAIGSNNIDSCNRT
jgi:formate dehydrogenase major subunit